MLMPSIFGERLFDDFMDDFAFPAMNCNGKSAAPSVAMRTDVKETENSYELDIELPGYKKEDVKAHLKDGYLTINASSSTDNEEKDKDGKYIRRERYVGSVSRSFYVGEDITEQDVTAKFENGILKLTVPKTAPKKTEDKRYIAIEG